MDVSCPSCSARYVTDDEKLRGKTARMRCKACNTHWMVTGPAAISAGPRAEAAPPSKRAAVVRKGGDRDQRDLFAIREPDLGSVSHRSAPPPSCGFSGIGARDENSVLFRVDQLRDAARVKTPAPEQAVARSRVSSSDDGVIDLKALSSAPPRVVAPLFSDPPPAMAVDIEAPVLPIPGLTKKRARWIVGAASAAALVLVTGMGLSAMFKIDEPVHATAAMVAPVEMALPAPVVSPAPVAAAAVDEPPAETKAEPKSAQGKRGKGGKARGGKSVASKTPAPKATPKPADPCGCKGNFNCILACTAKGRS